MSDHTEKNQSKNNETRNGLLWCAFGVAVMLSGTPFESDEPTREDKVEAQAPIVEEPEQP